VKQRRLNSHINRIIPRPDDNTYDVYQKYLDTGRLTFIGNFNSYEEAQEKVRDLEQTVSQADILQFFQNLKNKQNKQ
jgi:hypothetical protein